MRFFKIISLFFVQCVFLQSAFADNVVAQIERAKSGDVIRLAKGHYGDVVVQNTSFETPVIIDGGGIAVFKTLTIRQSRNLIFKNITVKAGPAQYIDRYFAVNIHQSSNITFSGGHIEWQADNDNLNDAMGMTIRLSNRIKISNNRFGESYRALVIRDADNVTVSNNLFRHVRSDGINVSGSVHVKLLENTCTDFRPVRPQDHPDCIQFWNDTAIRSNQHVVIARNTILRGRGGMSQGIFLRGLKEGLLNQDFLIEHNLIHQSMGDGIYIQKAKNITIRHNTILKASPVVDPASLVIRMPASHITLENNIVSRLAVAHDVMTSGTLTSRGDVIISEDEARPESHMENLIRAGGAGFHESLLDFQPLLEVGATDYIIHPDLTH